MNNKKYLVINPFGIGDVLFTTPLIANIKKNDPDSFVAYLCNKRAKAVFENSPDVDKLFVYERDDFVAIKKKSFWLWLKKMNELIQSIRSEKFQLVFDCSLNTQYGLMCLFAGIKERIGFDYKKRGRFLTKKKKLFGYEDKHVVEYYMELLALAGIEEIKTDYKLYLSQEEQLFATDYLSQKNVLSDDRVVALGPGGGASWGKDAYKKQWPKEKWAELTKNLLKNSSTKIFVCAAPGEESLAEPLIAIDKERVFTSQGLSLRQFMAVLSRTDVMVANDGGPLHMAAALSVATVGIFGPVDEKVYGARNANIYTSNIVDGALDCRPCYQRFRLKECQHGLACLKDLSVESVLNAIKDCFNEK